VARERALNRFGVADGLAIKRIYVLSHPHD
jgi:hypothetical protein